MKGMNIHTDDDDDDDRSAREQFRPTNMIILKKYPGKFLENLWEN